MLHRMPGGRFFYGGASPEKCIPGKNKRTAESLTSKGGEEVRHEKRKLATCAGHRPGSRDGVL